MKFNRESICSNCRLSNKNKVCNFCERKYENNKRNQSKSKTGNSETDLENNMYHYKLQAKAWRIEV